MGVTGGEPLGFNLGTLGTGGTLPGLDLVLTFFFLSILAGCPFLLQPADMLACCLHSRLPVFLPSNSVLLG